MSKNVSRVAKSLIPYGTSVFTQISDLARRTNAVNLSQGFPDFDGPLEIRQLAAQGILHGPNQYAPSIGVSSLRLAVSQKMARFYNVNVCPDTEVTVTAGATEALSAALLGIVNPGDEVIVLDPSYDLYPAIIARAGGRPVHVSLVAPDFYLDEEALTKAFSRRTKAIVINNPQNPCGKVFSLAELQLIGDLCQRFDAIAIGDEVYEHLVYDGNRHHTLLAVESLRDRAIVISSTAKTFSMTGWKVGFAVASPQLSEAVRMAHQFLTFCTPGMFQEAMATAIASDDAYYRDLLADYSRRRNWLADALEALKFRVLRPAGTYFLNILIDLDTHGDDLAFCVHLAEKVGVAAIPASFFYKDRRRGRDMVRFCFCKQDSTLCAAIERLQARRQ